MENVKLITLLLPLLLLFSCGTGDEEMDMNMESDDATVSLDDISFVRGKFIATGDEDFTIEGIVVGSFVNVSIEGKEYNVNSVTISSSAAGDSRAIRLSFYIPVSLDQTIPPNGTFEIDAPSAALDETFVDVFLVGDNDTYNSFSTTTGTVIVSGSSVANNMFDVVFNIQNLTSFDDLSADATGALKF